MPRETEIRPSWPGNVECGMCVRAGGGYGPIELHSSSCILAISKSFFLHWTPPNSILCLNTSLCLPLCLLLPLSQNSQLHQYFICLLRDFPCLLPMQITDCILKLFQIQLPFFFSSGHNCCTAFPTGIFIKFASTHIHSVFKVSTLSEASETYTTEATSTRTNDVNKNGSEYERERETCIQNVLCENRSVTTLIDSIAGLHYITIKYEF